MLLGGIVAASPARAQQTKRRMIAFLATGSPAQVDPNIASFRQGLLALGYGDEDIAIEIRYADAKVERLPNLAAELVHLAPEVIVTGTTRAAQAAKQATATIPIVMAPAGDPVGVGLVASLAHPGGNVTPPRPARSLLPSSVLSRPAVTARGSEPGLERAWLIGFVACKRR